MRVLGIDFGLKRIGFAVSDASGTLARPHSVEAVGGRDSIAIVSALVGAFGRDGDPIDALVVGRPARLDGSAHEMTAAVEAFAGSLRARLRLPVFLIDERLSSREAEALLARRYRDWRDRKARLDAAAAAIILQEFLDSQPGRSADSAGGGG